MKIFMRFLNQNNKSEIITPFVNHPDCKADEQMLVIPNVIKIDYSKGNIECFCFSLSVAEKILSNVCHIQVDGSNNLGKIIFPKSLSDILIESTIYNFKNVLELASNGTVHYINTDKQELKARVTLSQWLCADLIVKNPKAYINFCLNDYEIEVSDGSAMQFCERVKQHPLISSATLSNYFDFGTDGTLQPNIEYMCFWKVLKSDAGYKKYSNFINDCNDKVKVIYDEGKKYKCAFDGGSVDFHLLSIGDRYPKKVVIKIDEIKDVTVLESLCKNLNIGAIDLVCKISNISLSIKTLLDKLNFYKDDKFFVFSNFKDNLKIEYDIYNNIMNIKQEFKLDKIDKNVLVKSQKEMEKKVQEILKLIG